MTPLCYIKTMKDIPPKIRDDKFWKDVYYLVEHMYGKINDLITDYPDERWTSANKLRNAANDSLFYASQAVGSANLEACQYEWNNARKNLFALQSMYTFAAKQKFFDSEPEVIVKIDSLLTHVDKQIALSKKAIADKNKEELEPWLEKYRLWQQIQDK